MSQRGFLLLPVALALALVAGAALLLTRAGGMQAEALAAGTRDREARYVAEAAFAHARWRADAAGCSGYPSIGSTPLGANSYTASMSPTSGSPVSVTAVANLPGGISRSFTRDSAAVYRTAAETLVLQPGPAQGKDTYVASSQSSSNYGASSTLQVSYSEHPALQFDLSSLPAHARVLSAELELYATNVGFGGYVGLRRITRSWVEGTKQGSGSADGATWNTSDGSVPWTTPGGDAEATSSASVSLGGTGWYAFDVTALVDSWRAGRVANLGVGLSIFLFTSADFASSDDSNASLRPRLTITYACECGATCSSDLVAHWKDDEGAGPTALDSAEDHDGTLTGSRWTCGAEQGALLFDGTDDQVRVPHDAALSLTDELTLAAWVLPMELGGYRIALSKGTASNLQNYWLGARDQGLTFGFYDGAYREFTVALGLQTGRWYHVAATFHDASDQVRVYLDGAQVLAATTTRVPSANTEDLYIGRSQFGEYWAGKLDDVRIYKRALGAAEIAALAAATTPPVGLVLDASADAELDKDDPSGTEGGASNLSVNNRASKETRSLVRWNSFAGVPPGGTVSCAILRLRESNNVTNFNATLHRVTQSWTEASVSWNSASAGVAWTGGAGGSFDPAVLDTADVGDPGWKAWHLTPLVQAWVAGTQANQGVILKPVLGGTVEASFGSRESTNKPKLFLEYRP